MLISRLAGDDQFLWYVVFVSEWHWWQSDSVSAQVTAEVTAWLIPPSQTSEIGASETSRWSI